MIVAETFVPGVNTSSLLHAAFARAFRAHMLGLRGKSYPPESAGVTSGPLRPSSRFRSSFDRSPASIRDGNATIGRLNRRALDCCEPATEEASQHVRCDAACEQERLRYSALTAGKQLKRLAALRAKTTPSRGRLHLWPPSWNGKPRSPSSSGIPETVNRRYDAGPIRRSVGRKWPPI